MTPGQYWNQMVPPTLPQPERMPSIADLLATRDAWLKALLHSWLNGDLTFEQMACKAIVTLSEENDKYRRGYMKHLTTNLTAPETPK